MSATHFGARLETILGTTRVETILRAITDRPVVLLAGDPGVGKSTIARELARRVGGSADGTGSCVRAEATARGLSLEAFNALLRADPHEDSAIDARAATLIARGDSIVFESRLAGHLGRWLTAHGRSGISSIYLRCEAVVQALRLVEREDGRATREAIEPLLRTPPMAASLIEHALVLRGHPGPASKAATIIEREAARTIADRARLRSLYGVEFDDPSAYDHVFDTTLSSVAACVDSILALGAPAPSVGDGAGVSR
ncbi:MAG: AAA family ATPase [Deltaproteobacteria bacterium]|jgi:cytidylate kinase|nr:AAA family ATPase [Deltaproteobacteria bacterium]MBP6830194.1 AAA family ATPase [Deltaproteobacteria bacterium]